MTLVVVGTILPAGLSHPPDETCADYMDACSSEDQGPALDDVVCAGACDESTCCISREWCKQKSCFKRRRLA